MMRKTIAATLSALLVWLNVSAVVARPTVEQPSLAELVNKSYIELLQLSPSLHFPQQQIDDFKQQLEKEKKAKQSQLEDQEKQVEEQIKEAQKQLEALNKQASRDTEQMAEQRRQLHCRIFKLQQQKSQKQTERKHGVPIAYDSKVAKLDLIQNWPAKQEEIEQTIAEGRARDRRYGDAEDIGLREGVFDAKGQEKDIKTGQDAIREMKAYGLMPPELEDKQVTDYVTQVAQSIAANSDLHAPLHVTVLQTEEINAFALPGGFLFVNTGLIEKADTESELAGVLAHEIAHAAARHGHRMMTRATIANIIYQAAEMAAIIFTGGVVGVGTYYALQYGFYGLGMILDLALLGVNREYEAEADQLGVQYMWKAGYDPKGFVNFFDKMASEEGYIKSLSFFRTHPPFYDRMVSTFSEIEYLPPKKDLTVDSPEFHQAKDHLKQVLEKAKQEKKDKPTLRRMPQCGDEEEKPPASTPGKQGQSPKSVDQSICACS